MAREHLQKPLQDIEGNLLLDAMVRLLDPTTHAPIPETIYSAATGTDTRAQPFSAEGGVLDVYLDRPRTVDVGVTVPGAPEFVIHNVDIGDEEVYRETFPFSATGVLTVKSFPMRFYVEDACEVISVRASVGTAPVGASLIVDVNKNGVTIFSPQSGRPAIAAGSNTATVSPSGVTLASGDYLTIDVDQIGSSTAGADLTVQVRVHRI